MVVLIFFLMFNHIEWQNLYILKLLILTLWRHTAIYVIRRLSNVVIQENDSRPTNVCN